MALGALIGAYQEDDLGGLTAVLPLAGRTLVEFQVRCAAAAGASPVVVLVERIPLALNQAFERLRHEGLNLVLVSDGAEAATRFEAGELILIIGDGIVPPLDLLTGLTAHHEALVLTVPDDENHEDYERIDGTSRWSGVALVDGRTLGSTAAMVGDWDLPSTLLRRSLQAGAVLQPVPSGQEPRFARNSGDLELFERSLLSSSRSARTDAASRYVLPLIEDFATEKLMATHVRPDWLLHAALVLTLAAAFSFTRGWLWPAVAMLLLSAPLDLIARRLGKLRLKPIPRNAPSQRILVALGSDCTDCAGLVGIPSRSGLGSVGQRDRRHGLRSGFSDRTLAHGNHGLAVALLSSQRDPRGFPVCGCRGVDDIHRRNPCICRDSFFFVQYLVHRLRSELTPH